MIFPRPRGGGPLRGHDAGFTLVEFAVAVAILALLVGLAIPSYMTSRNQAAVAEANAMAQEWGRLVYSCWLQNSYNTISSTTSQCLSAGQVGFGEPNGKYWLFASSSAGTFTQPVNTVVTVKWPSANAGLENGETYVASVYISGSNTSQVTTSCTPSAC